MLIASKYFRIESLEIIIYTQRDVISSQRYIGQLVNILLIIIAVVVIIA